jgi:hypothetical protein
MNIRIEVPVEGLWTIEFGSNAGSFGSGVVVLHQGKVQGGDANYYFIGSYERPDPEKSDPSAFRGRIKVVPFLPGAKSVFNTFDRDFTVNLEGTLKDENNAVAIGKSEDIPGIDLGVRLTRRGEAA